MKPNRLLLILIVLVLPVIAAAACRSTTAAQADDVLRMLGRNVDEIEIPSSALNDIAADARLPRQNAADILEQTSTPSSWENFTGRVAALDEESGGLLSDTVVSNACDAAQGKLSVDSALENFADFGAPSNAVADLRDFIDDIYEATNSDDSFLRVNVITLCYLVSQAG